MFHSEHEGILKYWIWDVLFAHVTAERALRYLCFISAIYYLFSEWGSAVPWSFWMSSATHACIINGARKPLFNQTRLGCYSKRCPAWTLTPTSIVNHECLLVQQTLFHFYSFISILLISAFRHTTASFIPCWCVLLLTGAVVVFSCWNTL